MHADVQHLFNVAVGSSLSLRSHFDRLVSGSRDALINMINNWAISYEAQDEKITSIRFTCDAPS